MKDKTTFVVIQDWMFRLGLDLTETVIFAIIYGFSQDGETRFRGSWRYLEQHALCSRAKVSRTLKRLVELHYVCKCDKFVNGIKFCEYYAEIGSGSGFAGGISEIPPVSMRDEGGIFGSGGGISGRPNNIDNNADNKLSANRDNSARTHTPAFDFKKSLISIGVSEQVAADWMTVRKAKKATNTETAFTALKNQIEKICRQQGVTADEVARFAVGKDWKGINAEWDEVKKMKQNNGTHSGHITVSPEDDYLPGW